jgi:hypothetical protein
MKSASPDGSSGSDATAHGGRTGRYMITLCRLSGPVSIPPPRTRQLESFAFFTSCVRRHDGSERFYLHMGYFAAQSDAQRWLQRLRTRYPNAIVTPAPSGPLPQPNSGVPAARTEPLTAALTGEEFPPVKDQVLSDTQVMRILEGRRSGASEHDTDQRNGTQVEMLRPDDTATARVLKEAVVEGTPVPFAVQLEWSVQPIDPARVPLLEIFRGYTLYRTEKRRGGRSCYFLRLGFFTDAISAKEFACQVRSAFASAAVVPVTEQEFLHADQARIDTAAPADPLRQGGGDDVPDSDRGRPNTTSGAGAEARLRSVGSVPNATAGARAKATKSQRRIFRGSAATAPETLEETLEVLAEKELWRQRDAVSASGVRHLAITVEGRGGRRS